MRKLPPVELACHTCGCKYLVQPHRAERSKCCSRDCAQVYAAHFAGAIVIQRKRGTGKKHPYVKEYGRHQHRVVAERVLGRKLKPKEIVHHIDGNGKNNNRENLHVMTQSLHINLHRAEMTEARKRRGGY